MRKLKFMNFEIKFMSNNFNLCAFYLIKSEKKLRARNHSNNFKISFKFYFCDYDVNRKIEDDKYSDNLLL